MSEALPLLARRLVDPRPDGTPEFLPDSGNTGPVTLPIAFTPPPERCDQAITYTVDRPRQRPLSTSG
jgi:hypothetical protein